MKKIIDASKMHCRVMGSKTQTVGEWVPCNHTEFNPLFEYAIDEQPAQLPPEEPKERTVRWYHEETGLTLDYPEGICPGIRWVKVPVNPSIQPEVRCDFCGTVNNAHHSAECEDRRNKSSLQEQIKGGELIPLYVIHEWGTTVVCEVPDDDINDESSRRSLQEFAADKAKEQG